LFVAARTRQTVTFVAAAALGALSGCKDSGVEPKAQKATIEVSADVGAGDAGRSVALRAYYLRDGSELPLVVQPATITVSNASTVRRTISVDVQACFEDSHREIPVGFSAACRVYLVARLLTASGAELSDHEVSVIIFPGSGPPTSAAFTLPSGALMPAAPTVDFTMVETGQIPGATTVAIGSSTTVAPGVLSAAIDYVSGTGWLTAVVPAGQSAVTLAPSTTTPAPGRYEAIVRVTSTSSLFTPAEIRVAYVVPLPPKTVTITGAGNGAGVVLLTPNGTSCTTTAGQLSGFCTVPAPHGSTVTLTPSPAVGSGFTGWSGACQGSGACTLVMDLDRAITATFTLLKRDLTVDVAGTGSGSITSSPAGIACTATNGAKSGTCTAQFDHPTQVTLTAAANTATSTFTGWSGACTGTGACVVTMTEARNVTAAFSLIQRQLTVNVAGLGTGTLASSPAGIACTATNGVKTGTCSAQFDHGSSVTLTVVPGANNTFTGWGGSGCTGTGTCTVTMDQARTVTATIVPPLQTLTIDPSGNGIGGVTFWSGSTPCSLAGWGPSCVREFPDGMEVEMNIYSESSFGYLGVTGCDRMENGVLQARCWVTMRGARQIAVEIVRPSTIVTVLGTGTGAGRVTGAFIDCRIVAGQTSGECLANQYGREEARLFATADPGSTFSGWVGCPFVSSIDSACVVGSLQSAQVTARFTLVSPP
jgi:hypothetical protein